MRLFFLCVFSLILGLDLHAEEMLARVQRELRARKYYFGEIHGRATEETCMAIGKFQEARGIDRSGNLDNETLRALGLPTLGMEREEARMLDECCSLIAGYYRAWQSGDWKREADCLADKVSYYEDHEVTRDFVRDLRAEENARWPQRKAVVLQRIASRLKSNNTGDSESPRIQVTARIRTEVGGPSKATKASTEDLIFWLAKGAGGWRIYAVQLLGGL